MLTTIKPIYSVGLPIVRWVPRFSLKGTKAYLYEYDGYSGGNQELDLIINLLKSNHVKCDVSGADSPMNVASFEYVYYFDNGGFVIYAGNYFFGTPGQGAFVLGFKAFRWLLSPSLVARSLREVRRDALPTVVRRLSTPSGSGSRGQPASSSGVDCPNGPAGIS